MLWTAGRRAWLLKTPLLGHRSPPLPARCLLATRTSGKQDDVTEDIHWKTDRWRDKFFSALRTYKELNGNTLVPSSFVVPSDDSLWSEVAWGYKLGSAVSKLRNKLQRGNVPTTLVDELEELHFVQGVKQHHWEEVIIPALRRFYDLNGHTDVPQSFVVPTGVKTWPEQAWGWPLGHSVAKIRRANSYAEQVAASKKELESMKFCFTDRSERTWTEKILPALGVYRQVFDHCIVEQSFIVPAESPWPKKAWGIALGRTAKGIRNGHGYAKQSTQDKALLDSMGFAWDAFGSVWKERIAPGLKTFAAQNGHCKIPLRFVVPSRDPWPKDSWGVNLGAFLYRMRKRGSYFSHFGREADWLDALGLNMRLSPETFDKCVAPLLDTYATVTGDRYVPDDFVIPSEAPWPEKMWGVHLGVITARNAQHLE
ncbi:hypothetical protein PRNP1_001801 [Phytophthora ramorum]